MAEPGKETAATPPPLPQETVPHALAGAAVAEPNLKFDTPFSASQDTETAGGGAATLDSALPKAESAHRPPPPPQETVAMAAVGAPEQTTTEADAQQPVATMPQKAAALPPPAETPAQESAAPAAPTPPPQKQESGVPERASSVHEEEKDVEKAREEKGEEKPARRRWRCLRAAVCLLFLRPKSEETKPATPPGDKQPALGLEEKKPTPGEMAPPPQKDGGSAVRVPSKPEAGKREGETKPAALDGKRPEPGQEQGATLPPPAKTSSEQTTATAAEAGGAEKQRAAPAPQQPPRKQEGGAPEQAPSVQEGEENPARRRWRWLQAAVGLLFLRPTGGGAGETKQPVSKMEDKKPTPGEMPLPVDSAGKPAVKKGDSDMTPPAQDGKKPASGQQQQKKPSRKHSAGAARKEKDQGEQSKGRRDETQAGKTTPQLEGEHPSLKKFRIVATLVQFAMSLYKKHQRPQSQSQSQSQEEEKPETPSGPGGKEDGEAKTEEKQLASVLEDEKKTQHRQRHHPNWRREEVRLEHILEEAFTRLLATEYNKVLSGVRQKCLLTFSVFELASEVKKQAMIYWWVAEFHLRHRSDPPPPAARAPPPPPAAAAAGGGGRSDSPAAAAQGKGAVVADSRGDDAESIFFMLSDHGFLVPIKNWCSKVIHGCQVNPLVHWMLKRQARGDRFAELDDKGSPADLQLNSSILCLTSGNRPVLQKMRMEDESQPQPQPQQQTRKKDEPRPQSQAGRKSKKSKSNKVEDQQQPTTTKDEAQVGSSKSMAAADNAASHKDEDTTQAKDTKGAQNIKPSPDQLEHANEIPPLFKGKRVILNVNAHVYPISKSAFLNLAECLVVLQLGRWNNLDDKTYMEVNGLESQDAIGKLKNLRYLGLRGLSRLTELPKGIESLKKLVILDMRGCQNLVKVVSSVIKQLRQLTHLDLTECYMLEHIGQGITSLTELQVFKGFVFATGTQGKNKACRIQDLKKLKKLQKLTVSITTDANVGKGEMAELKYLTSLRKLTITWSEIPSILEGDSEKVKKKREELVERWTSFQLPKDLMKLDIRCYPKGELKLERHEKLEKLYLRGGDMQRFSANKSASIKTLRLRMQCEERIRVSLLRRMQRIKRSSVFIRM
ncbi:hypothetical protein SORBI_3004G172400 [Sorghum bicolor]|uniref:Disease resistance R13L4/SHOC-2-like LRR domain-containing protein n=1 Tax=Sorghum bicolor TaxID=4558 RepID=A0A194YQA1_SORBI|nr:hypothetical protein SORBI_3004G172400 [Sorghum bicolor]